MFSVGHLVQARDPENGDRGPDRRRRRVEGQAGLRAGPLTLEILLLGAHLHDLLLCPKMALVVRASSLHVGRVAAKPTAVLPGSLGRSRRSASNAGCALCKLEACTTLTKKSLPGGTRKAFESFQTTALPRVPGPPRSGIRGRTGRLYPFDGYCTARRTAWRARAMPLESVLCVLVPRWLHQSSKVGLLSEPYNIYDVRQRFSSRKILNKSPACRAESFCSLNADYSRSQGRRTFCVADKFPLDPDWTLHSALCTLHSEH